jgi:hypothetical protein
MIFFIGLIPLEVALLQEEDQAKTLLSKVEI